MVDTICHPPCSFKIAFIHWDLLTLTFNHLRTKAYDCVVLWEIRVLTKYEVFEEALVHLMVYNIVVLMILTFHCLWCKFRYVVIHYHHYHQL